ncbi:LuxR C-terminal-related transcriptional regulator [Streptomyces californicus]|uniref:helix-turn-helix transcriptional regulator n=1 Tax=Streptomyces californicus TaxID=67351 RepID=UPI0036BEB22E
MSPNASAPSECAATTAPADPARAEPRPTDPVHSAGPPGPPEETTLTSTLPQRGRDPETRRVGEALDCACSGGSTLVNVVGPRGMGKTRMLQEAADTARRRGFRLVREEARPPGHGTPGPGAPGHDVPTLVVIDEPFRPGPGASRVRPRAASHTVWMTTAPPGARAGGIDVPPFRCTMRLVLGPLSRGAARDLVSDLLEARPSAPLRRLLEQAGGHPGLLTELVRGLQEEGRLRTVSGMTELVTGRISEQACFYVLDSLAECSALCRQLLCLIAVLDEESGPEVLAPLLGVSTVALIPVLEEAYTTGLLHDADGRPAFVSPLARSTVAETVPSLLRAALRRERETLAGEAPAPSRSREPGPYLDGRQRLLLRMVAEGLTNQEMATRLELSPHTVNYHLRKLFRAFGAGSRIDLLNAARRVGHPAAPDPPQRE